MTSNQETFQTLMAMLSDYFDGLHQGDTARLRQLFHPDAVLKAPGLRRTRDEWLKAVAERPIPAQEGLPYRFKVLSLEVIQDQAMAKVECPLYDHFYIDFLGFLKENGEWLIVNKMYTDVARSCDSHLTGGVNAIREY